MHVVLHCSPEPGEEADEPSPAPAGTAQVSPSPSPAVTLPSPTGDMKQLCQQRTVLFDRWLHSLRCMAAPTQVAVALVMFSTATRAVLHLLFCRLL
jgi:hypothetical protein